MNFSRGCSTGEDGKSQEEEDPCCDLALAMKASMFVDDSDPNDVDDEEEESVEQGEGSTMEIKLRCPCSDECKVCGALPFRRSTGYESEAGLFDDGAAWDWDGGLYDLVRQMNGHNPSAKLTPDVAKATVEATMKHLTQLKEQLMKAGLQKQYDQKFTGESVTSARIIAPFDFSELELGNLMGVGGFNSVYEIAAFNPRTRESRRLHPVEELSRHYLMNHALLHPDIDCDEYHSEMKHSLTSSSYSSADHALRKLLKQPYARYAVKHLRSKLVTRTPDKFKRAAIDLVLEGQLLLVLDHPHIISIRGWSGAGPEAFASGDPREFFLVLDKLPESLEDRMWAWRTKLAKYQRLYKRRSMRQRRSLRVSTWVRRKLRGTQDEKEQRPPPPNKYGVKLQDLLLERLQTAAGIAQAIQYMHSKQLIHRDLKVANIGFDVRGAVKLFDLGLSRLLPTKKAETTPLASDDPLVGDASQDARSSSFMTDTYVMSRVGTKFYMAPEIRRKEPYNLSADVYSFGVVLWEILSLSTPRDVYHHEREQHRQATKGKLGVDATTASKYTTMRQQIKDGGSSWLPVCPCWPVGLQELVASALSSNPAERPTMEQVLVILQHHIDALCSLNDHKAPAVRRRPTLRIDLSHTDFNCVDRIDSSTDATLTCGGNPDFEAASSGVAVLQTGE